GDRPSTLPRPSQGIQEDLCNSPPVPADHLRWRNFREISRARCTECIQPAGRGEDAVAKPTERTQHLRETARSQNAPGDPDPQGSHGGRPGEPAAALTTFFRQTNPHAKMAEK